MKKCFLVVAVSVFLFSCADIERDNPYDMLSPNYIPPSSSGDEEPSSSSAVPSSSSIAPSSSSVAPSSSSSVPSSSSVGGSYGSVTYEGQTYRTVVIGTQTWFAENLNYNATGSKCYDGLKSNCNTYGRLYDWATAKTVCPTGWHLPSDAEWSTLEATAGGSSTAGKHLKSKSGWNSYNGIENLDTYGFSALPGGSGGSDGSFGGVGNYGDWWSATERDVTLAYYRCIHYDYDRVDNYSNYKSVLRSVRCLQN